MSVSDLKGKHISLGPKNSETERLAKRLLESAELDKDASIQRESFGVEDSMVAHLNGGLDAFFCLGAMACPEINSYLDDDSIKIKLIDVSGFAAKMNKKYGFIYASEVIPSGVYKGFNQELGDIAIWNILLARSDMPVERVYEVTKALFENSSELASVRKEATELKLQAQSRKRSVIPYHPGALKYFAEKQVSID